MQHAVPKHTQQDLLYNHSVGHNFVFFSGIVVKAPAVWGRRTTEEVWFRLQVQRMDEPNDKLFVSVSARAQLGRTIWENLHVGDVAAVTGRMRTGRAGAHQFNYVVADRVSGNFPVKLDSDPRYMRIRTDLWNRIAKLVGDQDLEVIPPKARQDLLALFGKHAGWGDDVEEQVAVDQPPAEEP
jgi:hypothetical protein